MLGNNAIYKNVLDEFRHARTIDEMKAVIKGFYPSYKLSSMMTIVYLYRRAVDKGVVSIPIDDIKKERKHTKHRRKKIEKLKYLSVKEKPLLGKSVGGAVGLRVYKRYGVRLWNNPCADIMSRVNSAKDDAVSVEWMQKTISDIFESYKMRLSKTRYNAYVMFLKGSGLVRMHRKQKQKGEYVIKRAPEIPRNIST